MTNVTALKKKKKLIDDFIDYTYFKIMQPITASLQLIMSLNRLNCFVFIKNVSERCSFKSIVTLNNTSCGATKLYVIITERCYVMWFTDKQQPATT